MTRHPEEGKSGVNIDKPKVSVHRVSLRGAFFATNLEVETAQSPAYIGGDCGNPRDCGNLLDCFAKTARNDKSQEGFRPILATP
ncbi:MAG: hypothetical protein MAG451_00475 [Anaerolineales bacterium]|nr:hypothetical protein [Anaerolineales bacterium]